MFPTFAMPYPASLLLTPDTSGFTAFVHETELEHSQYIILGLLNALIEADELGLTVAEIEGDAVLFYQEGRVPSAGQILAHAHALGSPSTPGLPPTCVPALASEPPAAPFRGSR